MSDHEDSPRHPATQLPRQEISAADDVDGRVAGAGAGGHRPGPGTQFVVLADRPTPAGPQFRAGVTKRGSLILHTRLRPWPLNWPLLFFRDSGGPLLRLCKLVLGPYCAGWSRPALEVRLFSPQVLRTALGRVSFCVGRPDRGFRGGVGRIPHLSPEPRGRR